MKKLMTVVALVALSAGAFADEAAPAEGQKAPVPAAAAAQAPGAEVRTEARRRPPTFDRAQFEARMKQRQAERRAKVVALLEGAGVPADKAPALAEEIEGVYGRRMARPPRPPRAHGNGPEGARGMRPKRQPKEPKQD